MIITCDACLTRFHVPDEKIQSPSMRMRCAKCGHRFVVETQALADQSRRTPGKAGVPPPLPRSRGSSAEEGWEQIELPPSFEDLTKSSAVAPTPPPQHLTPHPAQGTTTVLPPPSEAPTSPTPAPPMSMPHEDTPSYPARALDERRKYPSKTSSETDLDNVLASLPAIEETVPDLNPVPDHQHIPQVNDDTPRKPFFARVMKFGISIALVAFLILISLPILSDGEVSFDALSLRRWISSVTSDSLVTKDVTSGLYKSRNGREYFYIYGSVMNRGKQPTRAQVQAEIIEDSKAMGTARGAVGAVPTPEEIYNLSTPSDVEQLLKNIAPRTATLEPGTSAPFLVIFTEYPSNLYTFKLRVSASPLDRT